MRDTLNQLQKDYGDQVRIVFKHYVVHPTTATVPAMAMCAAQQQGKAWEMEDAIFSKAWEGGRIKDLSATMMETLAKDLGLDMNRFKADLEGEKCKTYIANDQKQLAAVGVRGTPAFFINGRYLSGAQPIDSFKRIIDEEIKKFDEAKMPAASYYQSMVVEKGKKSAP